MNTTEARTLVEQFVHRIAPEVDLDTVDPVAPLQDALDLDSMDFLNLVTAVHDETGVEIPERDYPQLGSLNGFVQYLVAATTVGGSLGGRAG